MTWLLLPVGVAFYFIPGMVAYAKHHTRPQVVLLFNLLIGWTLIGWVITLVWAIANPEAGITLGPPPGDPHP